MNMYSVFDGHCDTAVDLWMDGKCLDKNTFAISIDRARKLDNYAQFFAFCTAWMDDNVPHSEQFLQALNYFLAQIKENESNVQLCKTTNDIQAALGARKTAALLAIEGAEAVDCDPGRLDDAYEIGVRMISLVWNNPNSLTGSCLTGEGLTEKGKEFFRRAQKLNMLVDVSHLSECAFWDIVDLSEKPIVASHSNARAICPHVRNLSDEQFRAICQLGGTTGLNLYGMFLTENTTPTFDDVRRHLEHFLNLDGEGHIALGGDLDGCDILPKGFTGVDDYIKLSDFLSHNGYSDEIIQDVYWNSLFKVLQIMQ